MNCKLQREPYDQTFDRQLEIPMSWWLSIKNKYDHLCNLAIMISSITPHSAGCKRVFFTLAELVYASQKYIVDKLHEIVNDSIFLQFENVDETHENETILEPLKIPNHEVQVLIIEKFIDLKKTVRELDNENSDISATVRSVDDNYSNDDSSNENDENDNLEVKTDGYNIEELTNKYLLDNEDML
ncbi:9507_t:CDS:2 [Rhizophagus irregularis]|nr:9507_t:CDS:2 [Rhizophagus irregularis]